MAYVLTLDFETRDPAISLKRGAGWCFEDFEILGAAYKLDDRPSVFTSNMQELQHIVAGCRSIVAHNAQYDIGCLHRLKINYEDKLIVDTAILAKLYDNSMLSYSLDSLSKDILGDAKDYYLLKEAAESLGLRKYMSSMKEIFLEYPQLVADYAKKDVELTYRLSQWFKSQLYSSALDLVPFYSDLIKALVKWRSKGVLVDLEQANKSSEILHALQMQAMEEFRTYCPDVNPDSSKQLSKAFRDLGLVPAVSAKGGDSVDTHWRSKQTHPAVLALSTVKKYTTLVRDYVDNLQDIAENGRIYPEINILGAAETGRFSSSNPNIQQIPKRDPVATELIRSLYLAEFGESLYSLDFSSQEPRLQVHYAYLIGAEGADMLKTAFDHNPQHDLHQQVAELAGIDRKTAKTINLGISYGMGVAKLAASLKLDEKTARSLKKRYSTLTPYLNQLNSAVQESGTRKGYITTLLGRRLRMDFDRPYKALNKLIQGGAADQTAAAMVQAYREGIDLKFSVHDELVMSTASPDKARRLKAIMESIIPLEVPCYTEILTGKSWAGKQPLL